MRFRTLIGLLTMGAVLAGCSTSAPTTPMPGLVETELPASEAIGMTPGELLTRLGLRTDGQLYASELREGAGSIIAIATAQDLQFGARCPDASPDWNFNLNIFASDVIFENGRVVSVRAPNSVLRARCGATARGTSRNFVEDGGLLGLPFAPLQVLTPLAVDHVEEEVRVASEIVVGAELPANVVAWMGRHRGHARTFPGATAGESVLRFYLSSDASEDRPFASVTMQGARVVAITRGGDHFSSMRCRVIEAHSMFCRLGYWNVGLPEPPM